MNNILSPSFLLKHSCVRVKSKIAQNNHHIVRNYDKPNIVPGRSIICYAGMNYLFTPALTSNSIPFKTDDKRTANNFFVVKFNKYFNINKKRGTY